MMYGHFAIALLAAMLTMAEIGEGLVVAEGLRKRFYPGAAEIPVGAKVSDVIVILIALPGLVWCLGES
jgi:hypothetical protein